MTEWQPIETAPTERAILVAYQSGDVELIEVEDNDFKWKPCPPGPKQCGIDRPTHWLPIPSPPRAEGAE